MLSECPVLLDSECAPLVPVVLRSHLLLLAVLNKWVRELWWC